jgi:predicted metal-dependent phosphoesterase TrpH
MSPKKILAHVSRRGIDIIAITDHNTAENVPAVLKASKESNVVVLPGMEVCTREEVHVLAIFEDAQAALALQSLVYDNLAGVNNEETFGLQVVANEHDEVERFQSKLLIGATDLTIEQVVDAIHRLNGLAIAAHIDRESYSVLGQLGFIPETVRFDALEISSQTSYAEARKRFSAYEAYTMLRASDAHQIDDIGMATSAFALEEPAFPEIVKAVHNRGGRSVSVS